MIKDILNEYKWRKDRKLQDVDITYIDRGIESGHNIISGSKIKDLGDKFIFFDGMITPYHRIVQIKYEGKTIFERESSSYKQRQ